MKLESHDVSKLYAVIQTDDGGGNWRWRPGLIVSLKTRSIQRTHDDGSIRMKMKDPPLGLLIAYKDGDALVLWTLATL